MFIVSTFKYVYVDLFFLVAMVQYPCLQNKEISAFLTYLSQQVK